jgi:hypothetical protein
VGTAFAPPAQGRKPASRLDFRGEFASRYKEEEATAAKFTISSN